MCWSNDTHSVVRSHASSDPCVQTHFAHRMFSSEDDVAVDESRVLPAGGNSSSLISLTHVLCHIHLLQYSVSLRPFFLLCLSFYFSFKSQNMIHLLALFYSFLLIRFPLLIYLLSPDHFSLCFYVLFSSSSCFLLPSYLFTYIFCSAHCQLNPFLLLKEHLKLSNCHKAKAQIWVFV